MAKVKMLQGFSGAVDGNYNPRVGDVIDVSGATALDLVRRGRAVKVAEKRTAKKAAKKTATSGPPEAASTSAPEAAMKPKAQPRDG